MTAVQTLSALMPTADGAVLAALVELAEQSFKTICGRDDVPEAALPVIVRMAAHRYSQIGAEGLSAQSYSGASETLLSDYPEDLKREMYRWRVVRVQ